MLALVLVAAAVAAACSDASGAARQQPPPPTDAGGVPEQVTDGVVASVGLVRSAGVFGSGWVVAPGAVVTNEHVARTGTGDIYIDYSDGERVECYTAVSDRDMDLAVLKCDTGQRRPVALGGTAVPDTPVVAVGYPEGVGPTVTAGRITDERPVVRGIDTVGFTAAIEPGSSGSPVVDPSGRVLAIATFGGGFGVPVDRLRPLVEVAEQYPATKAGAEWQLRLRRSVLAIIVVLPIAALVARRSGRRHRLRFAAGWTTTAVVAALAVTQVQFMLQGPAHVI
jgi:S1-C subfamily serine protease